MKELESDPLRIPREVPTAYGYDPPEPDSPAHEKKNGYDPPETGHDCKGRMVFIIH